MARRAKAAEYPPAKIRLTGEAKSGKTTLVIAFAQELIERSDKKKPELYLWNTDGREDEYTWRLGNSILMPEAHPLDTQAVSEEVEKDRVAGVLNTVEFMVLDNMTHIFTKAVRGAGVLALNKAKAMAYVRLVLAQFQVPFVALSHKYDAAEGGNLKKKRSRDTISTTEEDRLEMLFNLHLETVEKDGVYGVIVRSCRYKPEMTQFTLWDKEKTEFKGFFSKLMQAVYGEGGMTQEEAEEAEPELLDFEGKAFPNPDRKATLAIGLGARYYEVHNGEKIFPFGDPSAPVEKKDGKEGTNGALMHARNTYEQIKSGKSEYYPKPKKAEDMTTFWIAECKRRIIEKVEALKQPPPPEEEPAPVEEEQQPEMTF